MKFRILRVGLGRFGEVLLRIGIVASLTSDGADPMQGKRVIRVRCQDTAIEGLGLTNFPGLM